MDFSDSVYSENPAYAVFKTFFSPALRSAFLKCVPSIFYNFFFRQYHAVFFNGGIPVKNVEHSLDGKIPFAPSWIIIYLDFIFFWVRVVAFFLRRYGRRAYAPVREFIISMGNLYAYAAIAYKRCLSTTKRPFYIARPRFFLIHLVDPHLMCVPSLHVMVVIHTYTSFTKIARILGEEEKLKEQALEMKSGALAIAHAILYVKQHSINCIAAALYAMSRYDPRFTPEDAADFTSLLFGPTPSADGIPAAVRVHPCAAPGTKLPADDTARIKKHILDLYHQFMFEFERSKPWEEPLINFLQTCPDAG
jgi:hypothetical protein